MQRTRVWINGALAGVPIVNPALVLGNVGLELATSTPLWFGGTYLFGWALRPVTVEVWVFSAQDGKQVWHESAERIVARKALKARPRSERSRKEVQLEASLRAAVEALARVLSEGGRRALPRRQGGLRRDGFVREITIQFGQVH